MFQYHILKITHLFSRLLCLIDYYESKIRKFHKQRYDLSYITILKVIVKLWITTKVFMAFWNIKYALKIYGYVYNLPNM